MNDAHLHLIVNHFPVIGTIFGLGILISGMFLKNNTIKNTSYFVFIVAAIFSFLSMNTGEGAEHMVEQLPTIGNKIIHEHEEIAEKLALVSYLLAIISISGIYVQRKNFYQSKLIAFMAMTVAFVAVFLAIQVGISGGEIRHTEIRENPASINNETELEKD